MKTPFELRKQYKEETGNSFELVKWAFREIEDDNKWNSLTIMEYIEWLESKVYVPHITEDLNQIINNIHERANH